MSLPPRGEYAPERACSRFLGLVEDGSERVCAAPPSIHIIWEDTPTGVETGWACEQHREEALSRWAPLAHHPVGACCGMPGARYFIEENECRYEDGLPTVEPVRAVAQEVAA